MSRPILNLVQCNSTSSLDSDINLLLTQALYADRQITL
jgi:hypothetical protein